MDADVIDLGIGQPQDTILPRELLRRAAMDALERPDNSYLQYGPEEGAPSVREALAEFLSRHYARPVPAADLLITNGASHGLDLILSRYTRPGDPVVIEAPTYFFGLDVLRDRGVRLLPVPVDGDGLDTDALAEVLRRERPAFIYTIPVFHNPTGVTLSPARRARLVELAAAYDVPIVADEVYQLVVEDGQAPAMLREYDADHVLSLGSFSKILGPGVRLGWIECAPRHVTALRDDGVLRSGGGASPMTARIVETAIRNGLQDEFLTTIRGIYDQRRRHAIAVLSRILPDEVTVIYPEGGYYIWLELPPHVDTRMVREEALAAGVDYRPGAIFAVDRSFDHCLRVCFAYYEEQRLTVALERLAKVLVRVCR